MNNYDAVITGSGCGAVIAQEAAEHGLKVSMIERGPQGGTCLKLGCIPSKIPIHPADRIMEIREAAKPGIEADINNIDFQAVMQRMHRLRSRDQRQFRAGVARLENLHLYEGTCRFSGERLLEVNGQQTKGKRCTSPAVLTRSSLPSRVMIRFLTFPATHCWSRKSCQQASSPSAEAMWLPNMPISFLEGQLQRRAARRFFASPDCLGGTYRSRSP